MLEPLATDIWRECTSRIDKLAGSLGAREPSERHTFSIVGMTEKIGFYWRVLTHRA